MSNTTKLSPGWRARLADAGLRPEDLGRIKNDRGTATLPKNIPIPANSDELAEMIGDAGRFAPVLANREVFAQWVQAYADKQQGPGTDLHATIKEETERALVTYLKNNGAELGGRERAAVQRLNLDPQERPSAMGTSHRQATAYNPDAPGAKLDGQFKNAGEYFKTIWHGNPSPEAQAKKNEIRNAYSSVVPDAGGALIPETLRAQLLSVALEMAVVRPRAFVVPMDSLRIPFPTIDSTTNVGSVFGGMIGYWTEESAALTATQAKFGRIMLEAKKLTGYAEVPNELFQDSIVSFSAFIERMWPQALAFFEDIAFMTGSGTGEPLGFIGAGNPASVAVTAEAGQATATVVLENIVKMYARMLPSSLSRAVWLCSPDVLPELFTMALSVGTGGSAVYLQNAVGPAPITILGRPVIVTEKSSTVGTRGDIDFVDLNYYLVGDRQTMAADSSPHYKFANDQTAFRIIQRVDGRPWLQSAITPANGGAALSPFVELATRP